MEHAINLRSLNLSGTGIGSIDPLEVKISTSPISAGAPLGPSHLRYLTFDNSYVDFLEPIALLHDLKGLSLDQNYIGDSGNLVPLADLKNLEFLSIDENNLSALPGLLSPLAGLTKLRTLSLARNFISDISAVAYLDKLEHGYFADNGIARIDSLAGIWFADDSALLSGSTLGASFTQSGNWRQNIQNVLGVVDGGYRYHEPVIGETATAQWQFTGLHSGQYEVWVTWPEFDNRASNAEFAIQRAESFVNGVATTTLTKTHVDQRLAPNGQTVDGVKWQRIGSIPIIVDATTASNSGFVRVTLQDVPGLDAANGVIAADAIRLIRVDRTKPLELVALERNPLGNQALAVINAVLEPSIEQPATPWKELTYTPNANAPLLDRTTPISIAQGQNTFLSNVDGYTVGSGSDPDGSGVQFSYSSDPMPKDVNVGSRYFSGDDVVILPNSLMGWPRLAYPVWYSARGNRLYLVVPMQIPLSAI